MDQKVMQGKPRRPLRSGAPERWIRRGAVAVGVATVLLPIGCGDGVSEPGLSAAVTLTFRAAVTSPEVSTLVVEVTAPDIPDPLVFNFELEAEGLVEGQITIPSGSDRTITVRAFDGAGTQTHEGSITTDVVPGENPAVTIVLAPLPGELPITVVLGAYSVEVEPANARVVVGESVQFTVSIMDSQGNPVEVDATWATDAPEVALVDSHGRATGVMAGVARIVASFAGVAGMSEVTVGDP